MPVKFFVPDEEHVFLPLQVEREGQREDRERGRGRDRAGAS